MRYTFQYDILVVNITIYSCPNHPRRFYIHSNCFYPIWVNLCGVKQEECLNDFSQSELSFGNNILMRNQIFQTNLARILNKYVKEKTVIKICKEIKCWLKINILVFCILRAPMKAFWGSWEGEIDTLMTQGGRVKRMIHHQRQGEKDR